MIDLSHTYLRACPSALEAAVSELAFAYPDPGVKQQIRREIAEWAGVTDEEVCLGNGSAELIDAITACFGGLTRIICPTFFLYDFYSEKYGHTTEHGHWSWDADNLAPPSDMQDCSLLWLCNPNNPTGHAMSDVCLTRLAGSFSGILAVDEAFAAFCEPDALPAAVRLGCKNILSVRSFSKEYGLPGIRLGYCVGPAALVDRIAAVLEPYNVNAFALSAGLRALRFRAEYAELMRECIDRRVQIEKALRDLRFEVLSSRCGFISVRFGSHDARDEALTLLEERGVLCMSYQHWEFTPNDEPCLRAAVPTSGELDKVVEAFTYVGALNEHVP